MSGTKIASLSDTHLGRAVPQAIGDIRREAYKAAFSRAIDLCIEQKVDVVMHTGDVFERRTMKPIDSAFAVNELFRLAQALPNVRMFMIRGNHDGSPENSATNYIEHPLAKYLVLLGDRDHCYCDEKTGMCVAGMSYERYARVAFEKVKPEIQKCLSGQGVKVLMLHNFVEGFHEIPPGTPEHNVIPLKEILDLDADIVLVGHEHLPKEASIETPSGKKTLFLTPGSTEPEDIGEEGQYGMYVIDGMKPSFVPIESIQRIQRVEVKGGNNPPEWYAEKLAEGLGGLSLDPGRQTIVYALVKGETSGQGGRIPTLAAAAVEDFRKRNPSVIYVHVEDQVRDIHGRVAIKPAGSAEDFVEGVLQPVIGADLQRAMDIAEQVSATLDEKASQKTQLLSPSDRAEFVKKWSDVLGGK